jgi:hypothetical protein
VRDVYPNLPIWLARRGAAGLTPSQERARSLLVAAIGRTGAFAAVTDDDEARAAIAELDSGASLRRSRTCIRTRRRE